MEGKEEGKKSKMLLGDERGLKEKPSWWFAGGGGSAWSLKGEGSPWGPMFESWRKSSFGSQEKRALSILNWLLEFLMLKVGMWVGIKSLEGVPCPEGQGCEGKRRAQRRGGASPACAPSCPGRG